MLYEWIETFLIIVDYDDGDLDDDENTLLYLLWDNP